MFLVDGGGGYVLIFFAAIDPICQPTILASDISMSFLLQCCAGSPVFPALLPLIFSPALSRMLSVKHQRDQATHVHVSSLA